MQEKPSPEALVSREHLTSVPSALVPPRIAKLGRGFGTLWPALAEGPPPSPRAQRQPSTAGRGWTAPFLLHTAVSSKSESRETVSWQHGFGCSPCMGVYDSGDRASLRCALAGGAGDSMVTWAGETVVLAAPGLFHGEGEQLARRCSETGESLPRWIRNTLGTSRGRKPAGRAQDLTVAGGNVQCSVLPHTRGSGDLSSRMIPHLFTSTLPLLTVSALCQPQPDMGRM